MAAGFDLKKRLGSGYFGEVWLATDVGLQADRAVKLIPPDKVANKNNFFHEAQVLKNAEHPNVVRVEETGTMADGRLYVAMEYLSKGSLEDEAKGGFVDPSRAKRIMIDVLRGLEHSHAQGIFHRDIKPANILVGNAKEGKLSDFGLSIPIGVDPAAFGMKGYMYTLHLAPELYEGKDYTEMAEVYSCGVTLYRLVNGDSYFARIAPNKMEDMVKAGTYPDRSSYRFFITRPIRTLINKCLNVDPTKRFQSVSELRHAVEQLDVCINWNEKILANGMLWTNGHNKRALSLSILRDSDSKWKLELKKGARKSALRRVTKHCAAGLTKSQAEQKARRLLQDYVLGKEK